MTSKASKQSKLMRVVLFPVKIIKKATVFYIKSMEDCAIRTGFGSAVGCPVAQLTSLPKSFSVNSSRASEDEQLRQLLRTVSNRNLENKVSLDMQRQTVVRKSTMNGSSMGRSYSVGVGKIGRIDEEKPCSFEEDDVGVKANLYPRSRSHAVNRNGVYL